MSGIGEALRRVSGAARLRLIRALELPLAHPLASALLVVLLSIALGLGLPPVFDVRVEKIYPEHDPERPDYERFKELFGSDDVTALCALELPVPVLSGEGIARVHSLTALLKGDALVVDGERLVDGERIVSLSNTPIVRVVDGDTLEVAPVWEPKRAATWDPAAMEALLQGHPIFAQRLLSPDGRMCAFWVPMTRAEPTGDPHLDRKRQLARQQRFVDGLRAFFSAAKGGQLREGEHAWLEGFAVTNESVYQLIRADMKVCFPLAWIAVLLGLVLAFRSPAPAGLAVLLMALAAVWTVGGMSWLGIPWSFISAVVPVMILVVCVSDAVHLTNAYRARLTEGLDKAKALAAAVHEVGPACFYTNVTSAAGFISLVWSDVEIVRELGIPLAIGTLAAWAITFMLLPPLYLALPELAPLRAGKPTAAHHFARLAGWIQPRALPIAGVWLLLGLAAAASLPWLSREYRLLEAFDDDHPLMVTRHVFEERMGGVAPFELLIEAKPGTDPGRVLDPDVQRALLALEAELRGPRFRELGALHACSVADLVADANWTFHSRAPELRGAIPESRAGVAQLLFVYGLGERDPTRDYVAYRSMRPGEPEPDGYQEPRVLRLQLRVKNLYTGELERLRAAIEEAARHTLPADLELRLTGFARRSQAISKTLVREMLESLFSAALSIGLLLALAAGSIRLGLLALVPNAIPILLVFATMVATRTSLSLGTSVICTIMLGIVVDDTIHFIAAHGERVAAGDPDPVRTTLAEAGASICTASFMLLLGFLVLLFSQFPANRTFGALSAATVLYALAAELTLTPALIHLLVRAPRETQVDRMPTIGPGHGDGRSSPS